MISEHDLTALAGKTMHGTDGDKIGKIVDVYESTEGSDGTFVTVSTGLFGNSVSFVPLAQASLQGSDVVVPYDKALVKDAPRVDNDEELTSTEEDRLYEHYRLTGAAPATTGVATGLAADRGAVQGAKGYDTSGRTTDNAMTRSEERLRIGTQRTEAGRARLRKRIVTEQESVTVPVSHDEVRVTREPITDAQPVAHGVELTEDSVEVTLTAETPVVSKTTVPVERVRLDTETVRGEQTVTEQVRSEQIEVDTDVRPDDRPTR